MCYRTFPPTKTPIMGAIKRDPPPATPFPQVYQRLLKSKVIS